MLFFIVNELQIITFKSQYLKFSLRRLFTKCKKRTILILLNKTMMIEREGKFGFIK